MFNQKLPFGVLFIIISTISTKPASADQSCQTIDDCKPNSFCRQHTYNNAGKCICKDGYIMDRTEDYYQCLKDAAINKTCTERIQCSKKGGVRTECLENVCTCVADTFPNAKGVCTPKIELNSICMMNDDCSWLDYATCLNGLCQCEEGMKESKAHQCINNATLGQPCEADENCHGDLLHCNETCTCKTGYVQSNKALKCLQVGAVGNDCEEKVQCKERAECVDNKCQCEPNSQPDTNGVCNKKIRLGAACQREGECSWILDAVCTNSICQCKDGMKASEDQQKCVPVSLLERNCTSDEHCNDERLFCKDNKVCTCTHDYAITRNNSDCLPAANNFGDSCMEDAQCDKKLERSVCLNNKCSCMDDMEQIDKKCVKVRDIKCQTEADCSVSQGPMKCENMKCICAYGKSVKGNECNPETNGNGSWKNFASFEIQLVLCFILLINIL